ncbi:hypothetical protein [Citricoccus nitrophenolicus]|uniref:hypothetical protein n=1 Tax=Citricoccus nitrophenolicus TaxID=863575 RepID=UPI0039B45E3E
MISTLTALTKTAKDDVQRTAIGAVTDVAAKASSQDNESDGAATDETQMAVARRRRALHEYSITAGDSPARSVAVDSQIYELDVLEALTRIVPSAQIDVQPRLRDNASNQVMVPDALVEYRGKRIVVEFKNYRKPRRIHPHSVLQVRSMLESSGADAGLIVAPVDVRSDDDSANIIPVVWRNSQDDDLLVAALDSVSGH